MRRVERRKEARNLEPQPRRKKRKKNNKKQTNPGPITKMAGLYREEQLGEGHSPVEREV